MSAQELEQQPLRYTLPQAAELLKISRATLYRRIADGELDVVRDGGRRFVTPDELHRYARRDH